MSCFTTKTPIPFGDTKHMPSVFTVLIEDHIWILIRSKFRPDLLKIQLYKFNTDTYQIQLVDCAFPEMFNKAMFAMKADQRYIYAFLGEWRHPDSKRDIFKMCIHTLNWEFVSNIYHVWSIGPIVDHQLFYIRRVERDFWVNKVDLTSLKFVRICQFNRTDSEQNLLENNGEVYSMKDDYFNRSFIVERVSTEGLQELSRYRYDNIDPERIFLMQNCISVGFWHQLQDPQRAIVDELEASTVYHHLYDFAENKWICKIMPGFKEKNIECISNLIVKDDMVFAVFGEDSRNKKLRIKMYEVCPKLSTICMMDLIDRKNDTSDLEPIMENLSIPLRHKLKNIMNWRIAENGIKLVKQQHAEAARESIKLENDGLVDHKLKRKLQTVFDSGFSDESDSDISDIEVEPHESSDDENIQRDDERRLFDDF